MRRREHGTPLLSSCSECTACAVHAGPNEVDMALLVDGDSHDGEAAEFRPRADAARILVVDDDPAMRDIVSRPEWPSVTPRL